MRRLRPRSRRRPTWVLRDFHSPNLLWLPEREGHCAGRPARFPGCRASGPAAYDLASLLQDARVDVPEGMEIALLGRYAPRAPGGRPELRHRPASAQIYATMAAQRATKILGIFARLDRRDGKPQYLRHMPRIWGYLQRSLGASLARAVARWYSVQRAGMSKTAI